MPRRHARPCDGIGLVATRLRPTRALRNAAVGADVPIGRAALPFVIQSVALSGYPVLWIRVDRIHSV